MDYPTFINQWINGTDSIECTTSGSTGTPKVIFLPRREVAASAWRTIRFFRINADSHLHSCISPDFIGGKMMAVRACECGAKLTWETPSNRPLREYRNGPIDLLAVVPSQMIDILDHSCEIPEIKHIIVGGAPIPPQLRERIAASPLDVWETYGMTETASHIALRKVVAGNIPFQTLPGIRVHTDSESRLIIEIDGWQRILTNDIAEITAPGDFRILGRHDNVIITGGKKVHPEVVENILEAALGMEVLISGEPDLKWGQKVVMSIASETPSDNELTTFFHALLPPESRPKIIYRREIPKTSNGKKKRQI